MSLWVDKKYANLVSVRLDCFKVKRHEPYIANCRCPFCGDSESNKFKARGYLVAKGQKIMFFCHNCGIKTTLGKLLERVDHVLYSEWRLESMKDDGYQPRALPTSPEAPRPRRFADRNPLDEIERLLALPADHPARTYVDSRRIPLAQQERLYFAPDFNGWLETLKDDVPHRERKEGRLILPFLTPEGKLFGFQGRSLDPNARIRYLTCMLREDYPKVFGLERLNKEATDIWIIEGPIDSLFMPPNTIAMAGSDTDPSRFTPRPVEQCIFVYDNEPRSLTIVKKIAARIEEGFRVVIWPPAVGGKKDVNDMILAGLSQERLFDVLNQNTFRGIEAHLRLTEWNKTNNKRNTYGQPKRQAGSRECLGH